MSRKLLFQLLGVVLGACIILIWKLLVSSGTVPRTYLPDPVAVWMALVNGFAQHEIQSRLLLTLEHMLVGWFLASLIGVGIGSLIGLSRFARAYIAPTLEMFRPLPASALFPVAISLLGLSENMVLSVIAFGAVWPTLLSTIHGFETVNPRLVEVRRMLQMPALAYVFKVALPNASPDILAGMRLSLTYSLILSVTGEMLSSSDGLGFWIMQQARSFRADYVFAGVLLFGAIGYVTSQQMYLLQRYLLRWRPQQVGKLLG